MLNGESRSAGGKRLNLETKAPYPYWGGKSRVAHLIWEALGDPAIFAEPFFGSGAVTLARPHAPRRELLNDADGFVANFWRSIKSQPARVAEHADWPSNELDMLARHRWICEYTRKSGLRDQLANDPDYHDAQIAGRWVWLMGQWLGSGCCRGEWFGPSDARNHGTCLENSKLPRLNPNGIFAMSRRDCLTGIFDSLSKRLRHAIVACGDWKRVVQNSGLPIGKDCAAFLDPPYDHSIGRDNALYAVEMVSTTEVESFCRDRGTDRACRLVLAGFEGEYKLPGWRVVPWERSLTWAKTHQALKNRSRERLWFSPACQIGPEIRLALRTARRRRASLSEVWHKRSDAKYARQRRA